jgi:hypothetical protein
VLGILIGAETSRLMRVGASCVGLPPLPSEGVGRRVAAWGPLVRLNKGVGPRIPLAPWWITWCCISSLI